MSKKANSTVDKLLNELLVTVKEAKGIATEQAPEIARQMIEEKAYIEKQDIYQGIVVFVVGLAFLGLSNYLFSQPGDRSGPSGYQILGTITGIISLLTMSIGFFGAWGSTVSLKRLKIAPKVYLLRELAEIAHGRNEEDC